MRGVAIIAAAAVLGGCGEAKKSFDDSFNKNFHEKFVSSCISSAMNSGVTQDLASKVCTCASDKVRERYSVQEKMTLKPDQLKPIVAECKAAVTG